MQITNIFNIKQDKAKKKKKNMSKNTFSNKTRINLQLLGVAITQLEKLIGRQQKHMKHLEDNEPAFFFFPLSIL